MQLFHGVDTYGSYHALIAEAHRVAAEREVELNVVEADEINLPELYGQLLSPDLFGMPKVVVIKRLLERKELATAILDEYERWENLDLLVWQPGKAEAAGLGKKLVAAGQAQEFPALGPDKLHAWLADISKQSGLKWNSQLSTHLISQIGDDRWQLSNEMEKLTLYAEATGQQITPEILQIITESKLETSIWKLLDNIDNKKLALAELESMFVQDVNDQYLITMLSWKLTQLATTLQSHSAASAGMKPYVYDKSKRQASKLGWKRIAKLSRALLRMDLAIKQGRVDARDALSLYLLTW